MSKPRILLDCDGVIADFCTACFDLIERHTGDRHTHDQVTHWDLFKVVGKGHLKPLMKEEQTKSGWCINFPMYEGAQEGVRRLEAIGDVIIVTSPMTAPHWAYERTMWLDKHFGIPKARIVHAESKHFVKGDVLIDDADENCFKWRAEHPNALTLLWDAPYNRSVDLAGTKIVRIKDWDEACAAIHSRGQGV